MDTAPFAVAKAGQTVGMVFLYSETGDCLSGVLQPPAGPCTREVPCWSPAHHQFILSILPSSMAWIVPPNSFTVGGPTVSISDNDCIFGEGAFKEAVRVK